VFLFLDLVVLVVLLLVVAVMNFFVAHVQLLLAG
jgi:hypothetical protein